MKDKQGHKKKIISGVIVLIWMFIIGSFSAQTGGESSGMSQKAAVAIVKVENKVFQKNWGETQIEQRSMRLQFPIRKCAHMSEYGLLAVLVIWHFCGYAISWKNRYLFAWLFATVYAMTDELHQLFVPGRSGQLMDVWIDSAGALLGLFLFGICRWISRKARLQK